MLCGITMQQTVRPGTIELLKTAHKPSRRICRSTGDALSTQSIARSSFCDLPPVIVSVSLTMVGTYRYVHVQPCTCFWR